MHYKLRYLIPVGLILFSLFFFFQARVFAQDYVLPYPGFIPGHPLYKISQVADKIEEFWSFGSFAKFKYCLGIADKKLVEAKTLFEYRQFLLASQALLQYESYLRKANYYLQQAQKEGKDVSSKKTLLKSAIVKHREVLEELKKDLPERFLWTPEKDTPQTIEIKRIIDMAIGLGQELKKE